MKAKSSKNERLFDKVVNALRKTASNFTCIIIQVSTHKLSSQTPPGHIRPSSPPPYELNLRGRGRPSNGHACRRRRRLSAAISHRRTPVLVVGCCAGGSMLVFCKHLSKTCLSLARMEAKLVPVRSSSDRQIETSVRGAKKRVRRPKGFTWGEVVGLYGSHANDSSSQPTSKTKGIHSCLVRDRATRLLQEG